MELDMMIFDLDINQQPQHKTENEDNSAVPCAPPPSPSFGGRRKTMDFSVPYAKLLDCCEDLIQRKVKEGALLKSPALKMKRKNSDSDELSSYGSSPDCSSVGKRIRSSLELDSFNVFKSTNFSSGEFAFNSANPVTVAD